MRHFLLSNSISALPVRVRPSALAAGLIATARRTERQAPRLIGAGIALVQLMGKGLVAGGLRMAWSESNQLRLALGEHEF